MEKSLYERLGGYDAIVAVVEALLPKLQADEKLRRFWLHRGADGVAREKQLLVDYLCNAAGGPLLYVGRDMELSHRGMGIDATDWLRFITHLEETLNAFRLPQTEKQQVLAFIASLRDRIVEA